MKKLRKIFCLLLTLLLCTNVISKADAHTDTEVDPSVNSESAIEGIAPDGGTDYSGGTLTDSEMKNLKKHLKEEEKILDDQIKQMKQNKIDENIITPYHINLLVVHKHYIDSVGPSYNGYIDRGECARGKGDSNGILQANVTNSCANGYNCSISFEADVVTASVGYSVTYEHALNIGWSCEVPAGKMGHIGYKDWYHCNNYSCHTWNMDLLQREWTDYGSGQARQWYLCEFYSWTTIS